MLGLLLKIIVVCRLASVKVVDFGETLSICKAANMDFAHIDGLIADKGVLGDLAQ